ncbi:MAG: putative aminoacrylate hydrolase RutD [Planctomycetes bacterium ADurb.Bin401]|jgi:fermentation-respiration switch protein FrsA (DUF1100 family)|nr:MAG: putative aminoacrylate hydrolase RutD [Planctomycetes bacterium ADurb.Bin401]
MLLPSIILILLAYWLLGTVLFFMQPRFIFNPTKNEPYTPANIGLPYEKVLLRTPDRLILNAWFIPAHNAEITILFCHGNGGNISYILDSVNIFNELGYNTFVFDYRGYGTSQGTPTEQGTYIDAQTAYDWLTHTKAIHPKDIIIFGRSLGGSIAANLASNVKAKGLIIESAFTSYADIGVKFYPYMPVRLFARYEYETKKYLPKVHYPVLIIHSRTDEVVPFEFGLRLYELFSNEPKDFIEIFGNHNDGFLYSGAVYRDGISNWVQSLTKEQRRQIPLKLRIVK